MADGGHVHWLRGNSSEWSPRYVGFFDTETFPVREGNREELRLRLWVAGVVDRQPGKGRKPLVATAHGATRQGFARWVNTTMVGKPNLWLFAHNLGFDLTTTRLPDELHRLGWTLGDFRFAGRNVTGYLKRKSKTVWLVDSTSWLPHKLEQIGSAVESPKLPMPAWEASEEAWLDYCTRDVLVLAEGVLTLMDWWDRERLGHWAKTGPGCGWNAARHMSRPKLFLMKPDPVECGQDRRAVYGGRRDVTRIGPIKGGPFLNIDFQDAYLTVLAHMRLPKARLTWHHFDLDGVRRLRGLGFGALAECEVACTSPRWPLRTPRGVFYPVGRFWTVLADPELADADRRGELLEVGSGFLHDTGYPLQEFGHQALEWLDPARSEIPAVVKMMVKQWGRSVPGKFAARTSKTLWTGPATWPGWHLERGTSGPEHKPAVQVNMAGRQWWLVQDVEGENSYPAVLAWIQSYVSVALGRMLDELGEELWVLCDTDGFWLDCSRLPVWLTGRLGRRWRSKDPIRAGRAVCDLLAPLTAPLVPRVKRASETLTVAGPQHYSGDDFERQSGRPGRPEYDESGELHHWAWPKVKWQMEHGSPGGYVRVEKSWSEPAVTAHRWILEDGRAVAPCAWTAEDGTSGVVPWSVSGWGRLGWELAGVQAPALRDLI